jgi:hypothetical protein
VQILPGDAAVALCLPQAVSRIRSAAAHFYFSPSIQVSQNRETGSGKPDFKIEFQNSGIALFELLREDHVSQISSENRSKEVRWKNLLRHRIKQPAGTA